MMRKVQMCLAVALLCAPLIACQTPFSARDGIEGPQERFIAAKADLTGALAMMTETAALCAPEPITHPCWGVVRISAVLAQEALDTQAEIEAVVLSGDPPDEVEIAALIFAIEKLRGVLPKE